MPAAISNSGEKPFPRAAPTRSGPVNANVRAADDAAQKRARELTADPACPNAGRMTPMTANAVAAPAPNTFAANSGVDNFLGPEFNLSAPPFLFRWLVSRPREHRCTDEQPGRAFPSCRAPGSGSAFG